MRTYSVVFSAILGASFVSEAADVKPKPPPPTGSATTQQESSSHPAAEGAGTSAEKAKPLPKTPAPAHPAAKNIKDSPADATSGSAATIRSWRQIDADRDNSISPEEMQKFLEADWAKRKQPS